MLKILRCHYCGGPWEAPVEFIGDEVWHRTCVERELSRRERLQLKSAKESDENPKT